MVQFIHFRVLCFLCVLITVNLNAQNYAQADTTLASHYQIQGDSLSEHGQYKQAVEELQHAINIYEYLKKWDNAINCMIGQAVNHFYLTNYAKAEGILLEGIHLAKSNAVTTHTVYAGIYDILGVIYDTTGEYDKALEYALQGLSYNEKNPYTDKSDLNLAYNNVGVMYSNQGDFDEAIRYYKQALYVYHEDTLSQKLVEDYINISLAYYYKKEYDNAFSYAKKALLLLSENDHANAHALNNKINTYNNIALILSKQKKYAQALPHLQKAEKINQHYDYNSHVTYTNLGYIYYQQKQYTAAIPYFEKAIAYASQKFGNKHFSVAECNRYLGNINSAQQAQEKALFHYQKSLEALSINFTAAKVVSTVNPAIKDLLINKEALRNLTQKAHVLQLYAQKQHNLDYLKAAFNTITLAISVLEELRDSYETESSKNFLAKENFNVFESAIAIALQLYEQTNNEDYKNAAFNFAQKSKANTLLSAVRYNQARVFADIPAHLLEKEANYKRQLAFYQEKLFKVQQSTTIDSLQLQTFNAKIFELKQELGELIQYFEQSYPTFYQMSHHKQIVNLSYLQTQLRQQKKPKLIIEYFVGQQQIYAFGIQQNTLQVIKLPINIIQEISAFQQSVHTDPFATNNWQHSYTQYIQHAQALYNQLLKPFLYANNTTVNELIIIPDGPLGYLAFEALLTAPPKQLYESNYTLHNMSYVLEEYQITYAYSSSLLFTEQQVSEGMAYTLSYAGCAPGFAENDAIGMERDCNNNNLSAIPKTINEINEVNRIIDGQVYINAQATKNNFLDIAKKSQIIHLATHACVNSNNPLLSKLYFADSTLSVHELYQMQLNAELAILSACNTGTGKFVRGEGIMSLARGFMYAGCPNIITGLWQANDYSTAEIMVQFSRYLLQKNTQSAALRKAKLAYLNNQRNQVSAPYFWATFVHVGNPNDVIIIVNNTYVHWYIGLLVGLLLLLLAFLNVQSTTK